MKIFLPKLSIRFEVNLFLIILFMGGLGACTKQKGEVHVSTIQVTESPATPAPQVSSSVLTQRTLYPYNSNYRPKGGYIPDEATAIKIAEALIVPVWGADCVKSEQPFTAVLVNGIWIVEGTLINAVGGTAYVQISKETGCVLNVGHGK